MRVILDTRTDGEYCGTTVRAARGGAIPGAVHIEWTRNLGADGAFKPAAELTAMYEAGRASRRIGKWSAIARAAIARRTAISRCGCSAIRACATISVRGGNGAIGEDLPIEKPGELEQSSISRRSAVVTNKVDRFHQSPPRSLSRRAEGRISPFRASARCPSTRPTCGAAPSGPSSELRAVGLQNVQLDRDARQSGRLRRVAGRAGRADDPLLRALRRAAGRSRSSCGRRRRSRRPSATARSTRAARPTTRGRSSCTSRRSRRTLKQTGKLPVNIKVIHRGRRGSRQRRTSTTSCTTTRTCSRPTCVVISDSPMFDRGVPSICYGLRGLAYFQIDVRGTNTDLHSGSFGGAVANPAFVLAQILAQMKDKGGRIKIPGFYDDVRALRTRSGRSSKKLPFNEKRYREGAGRAEAVRRERLHDARARLGDVRRSR